MQGASMVYVNTDPVHFNTKVLGVMNGSTREVGVVVVTAIFNGV